MSAVKALDKRALWKTIRAEEKRAARERLRELRGAIKSAKAERKAALGQARDRCRAERLAARDRARALRVLLLEQMREAVRGERAGARQACAARLGAARELRGEVARRREKLAAERAYQKQIRQLERQNLERKRAERAPRRGEQQSESDDEVRGNIPPELLSLFERIKRGIKGGPRMTRTEAFLHYAEEHLRAVARGRRRPAARTLPPVDPASDVPF